MKKHATNSTGDMVASEEAPALTSACQHVTSFPPLKDIPLDCKKLAVVDLSSFGDVVGRSGFESMKASSPRHAADTEHGDWMEKHPSALAEFQSLLAAAEGKQIVMFLDYDGTLSPIVEDPDKATMSEVMREAVRSVAKHFPTAIVSGRCRDQVFNFVKLTELYYAGSHGMDIQGPSNQLEANAEAVNYQAASEFLLVIEEVFRTLTDKMEATAGAKVENNKYCLSVHFRCVQEEEWDAVNEKVRSVLEEYPNLKLTHGRKVLEIRPSIKWDKGKALEFLLLKSLGYAERDDFFPIYIGDDRTDEDAFQLLRDMGKGIGILVSKFPKETVASYSLSDPAEVKEFLGKLAKSKGDKQEQTHHDSRVFS